MKDKVQNEPEAMPVGDFLIYMGVTCIGAPILLALSFNANTALVLAVWGARHFIL